MKNNWFSLLCYANLATQSAAAAVAVVTDDDDDVDTEVPH